MKIIGSLLSLLLLAAAASADFVVVQKVDGLGQQSGNITVKIKDGKARTELAPQISQLIDGDSGDTVTLMHGQKSFMKVSAAQTKALLEQMQKIQAGGNATTPPAKPVADGHERERRGVGDRSVYVGRRCHLGEVLGGKGLSKLSGDSGGHGQTPKRRSHESREEPYASEFGFSRHDREDGNQDEG
jgi:hypothetical protein